MSIVSICLCQVDPETGEYVRNSNGFCVQAGVNEPGELVGAIRERVRTSDFDGYTDAKATNKKVYKLYTDFQVCLNF